VNEEALAHCGLLEEKERKKEREKEGEGEREERLNYLLFSPQKMILQHRHMNRQSKNMQSKNVGKNLL
jgi:hypothetical protein